MLQEADSNLAHALACSNEVLLMPDFWLNEATNVLWLQVRRKILQPAEAQAALILLRNLVEPTPTHDLRLHDVALEIGMAIGHATYDTLYLAFAIAVGARAQVVADRPFITNVSKHTDGLVAAMLLPLEAWAQE